jgi:purine-nucleoside phosphorylase
MGQTRASRSRKAESSELARIAAWGPEVAVVFGSGLAELPPGSVVEGEYGYGDLGWPCTIVPGHANRLLLVRAPVPAGARGLKLALACGRPHRYEGWPEERLQRAVHDLSRCGVRRLVLTNSCGGLGRAAVGELIACHTIVDLQTPPRGPAPERIPVCSEAEAARAAAVVASAAESPAVTGGVGSASGPATGVYVALTGPQFETPAEAAWLSRYGDVVGMSAAPEARAAVAADVDRLLLALVVNRAAEVASHDDVLAVAGRLGEQLADRLVPAVLARWPELGLTGGS